MKENTIAESNNAFALELYNKLKSPNNNLFISPLSIFTAITMVYAGARGATEEEIKNTLHLMIQQRRLPLEIKNLVDNLLNVENTEINIANSVWTDNEYELLETYTYIIEENYDGELYKEDFGKVQETCDKINSWVNEKTKEKISDILSPSTLEMGIKLILINAIYFNGTWEKTFKEDNTNEAPFYLLSGKIAPVPLMFQQESFSYFETETFQVLKLDYEGGVVFGIPKNYEMLIYLPKEREGLENMEKDLTIKDIKSHLEQLESREVKVYIPKLKIETTYELAEYMKQLGMQNSFTAEADFTGIAKISPIISEIIHKAFVDINEEGTEAAAATMITMAPKGMPVHREIPIFKADHPFLFLIQESETKTIMFLGRVLQPTKLRIF